MILNYCHCHWSINQYKLPKKCCNPVGPSAKYYKCSTWWSISYIENYILIYCLFPMCQKQHLLKMDTICDSNAMFRYFLKPILPISLIFLSNWKFFDFSGHCATILACFSEKEILQMSESEKNRTKKPQFEL